MEGVKRKERQSTYMYHVCFWICSNCKIHDRGNGRSVHKQRDAFDMNQFYHIFGAKKIKGNRIIEEKCECKEQ